MEFWSPVFWVGYQVPCLQVTIYFESSDFPKVINFCGIGWGFFARILSFGGQKKCNFAKLIFSIGQNLIGEN